MAGIRKRLGSILGPEGRVPQFVEGTTTPLSPSEPAKVDLTKTGEAEYRVDFQVPRGLDGDPTAVANLDESTAVLLNDNASAAHSALIEQNVQAGFSRLMLDNTKKYQWVSCALRNNGAPDYWQPIHDDAHTPIGISSVDTRDSHIRIVFTQPGSKVISSHVVTDEAMALGGYLTGASVGLGHMDIYLSKTSLGAFVSYDGTGWVATGDMTVRGFNSATLTLEHRSIRGANMQVTAQNTPLTAEAITVTHNTTSIAFRERDGTLVTAPDSRTQAYVSRMGGVSVDPRPVPAGMHNLWVQALIEVP